MPTFAPTSPPTMACMEVWGGNQATDKAFSTLGLETWVYSRPYQQAAGGGDVYYISSCATGRITRLMVADISGHGAEVADTGARLRSLMRRHVNHVEQTQFMGEMNREFGTVRHSSGFATAVAASFFSPDGRLTVTNAGHPPPLFHRRSTGTWSILNVDGDSESLTDMPLGMLDEMAYEEFKVAASPGDLVMFYTDSLIEAKRSDGRLLGPDGLLEIVATIDGTQPDIVIAEVLKRLAAIHPENLTDDDVTVLLFRPTGTGTTVPLKNRLFAPWLFLGGCLRAILTGNRLPLPEFTWSNLGGSVFDRFSRSHRQH
ncbi:MAG: PP2C family protein-serine/threonine phosphatase [Planctomycetaceae bacterium]